MYRHPVALSHSSLLYPCFPCPPHTSSLLLFPGNSSVFIYTWYAYPYILWDKPLLLQLESENLCQPGKGRKYILFSTKDIIYHFHSVMGNISYGEQYLSTIGVVVTLKMWYITTRETFPHPFYLLKKKYNYFPHLLSDWSLIFSTSLK